MLANGKQGCNWRAAYVRVMKFDPNFYVTNDNLTKSATFFWLSLSSLSQCLSATNQSSSFAFLKFLRRYHDEVGLLSSNSSPNPPSSKNSASSSCSCVRARAFWFKMLSSSQIANFRTGNTPFRKQKKTYGCQ